MAKVTPISEQFQHFLAEMKESFSGDLYGRAQLAWKKYFEAESERLRNLYSGWASYQRSPAPGRDYRNGYYERDFVTRFGILRLRIARTRRKNFLPPGLEKFQRRAPELTLLIREAFLRGISTRQVGRVVATLTTAARAFAAAGGRLIPAWCGSWSATCRNYWRSSACRVLGGGSCAPPTSSSAASWRCAVALGP